MMSFAFIVFIGLSYLLKWGSRFADCPCLRSAFGVRRGNRG